jgi:hypothetical protein
VLLGGFDAGADDSGVAGAERRKHDDHLPAAECNSSENATPSQNATEISAANMMITSLRQPGCNSSDNTTPSQNATLLGNTATACVPIWLPGTAASQAGCEIGPGGQA